MVALMVVVTDERRDVRFEIAGQEIFLKQNAVLQRLMPAFNLALGLRMIGRAMAAPRPITPSEQRYSDLKATIADLAESRGVNPKTVMKRRDRDTVEDRPMGSKAPKSTVLTAEEEAACVAFRRHILLPLDDCLYALQASIPHLTRSSLSRLFQRHNISRLPDVDGTATPRKKFKSYPMGYFHIDIAEVRTEEGLLYMFVAIDRTSKLAVVELREKSKRAVAADFLKRLVEAVPYAIHTVLTDNGTHFTTPEIRPQPQA